MSYFELKHIIVAAAKYVGTTIEGSNFEVAITKAFTVRERS